MHGDWSASLVRRQLGLACDGRHRRRTRPPAAPPRRGTTVATGGEPIKIGFITKFPVDFYDTMVDAAKTWNKDHPEVELVFAQGASGTDDEGEIAPSSR